tara:strand:- start:1974 stop:2267 length:294 start_codon:yes stop_codon:yes gene_type:complete
MIRIYNSQSEPIVLKTNQGEVIVPGNRKMKIHADRAYHNSTVLLAGKSYSFQHDMLHVDSMSWALYVIIAIIILIFVVSIICSASLAILKYKLSRSV